MSENNRCFRCDTPTEIDEKGLEYCPECNIYIVPSPPRYDTHGEIHSRRDFYRND